MDSRVAVILAGGHGECLRLGQDYIHKLVLPIGPELLLEHQIAWLREAEVRDIVLCLGLKADQVRSRFGDGSRWGVKLRYSVEEKSLGTAGVVKALGLASLPDSLIVLPSDIYARSDCRKFFAFHETQASLATVAVGPATAGSNGNAVVMGPSLEIIDFPDGTQSSRPEMAALKVWIIRRSLLHFVPDDRPSDFIKDIFPAVIKAGESIVGYPESGELLDIGAPGVYESLLKRLAKKKAPR